MAPDLARGLLMAARDREDDVGIPPERLGQRCVGCGIARVQAYHEVYVLGGVEALDVADLEPQSRDTQAVGQRGARLDHVALEIEPDELHLPRVYARQKVVQREREIRLSATKIDDP